jgi:hypothetical protein
MSGYKYILDHGSMKRVDSDFKAQYRVEDASEFFSPVTNMIPALSSVSGARVMIGDKASVQAMTLVNREAPLVQAATKKGAVFAEEFGRLASIRSNVAGTVHSISEDHIVVKDEKGVAHSHDKHTNYIVGRESHMDHTPVVKVGDKVTKDHLLATSNYSDHEGKLAVGMNLKTAIMPFRSMNFEDALAISESAAKKLEGEQLIPVRLPHCGQRGGEEGHDTASRGSHHPGFRTQDAQESGYSARSTQPSDQECFQRRGEGVALRVPGRGGGCFGHG